MATIAQIKQTAAENLGVFGMEGETLPSYVTSDMGQAYTELYEELQAVGLTAWSSTANIPDQYAHSIGMLVAEKRAVKYKVPMERYQQIKVEAQQAMAKIRELQARSKMGQTEIENY